MKTFSTMISAPSAKGTYTRIVSPFFAVACFSLAACHKPPDPVVMEGKTMGTYWRVTLASPNREVDIAAVRARIGNTLDAVNRSMSTYLSDSELMRFNAAGTTRVVAISAGLRRVIAKALTIARQSDGYYDVTVGPLVEAWGFGAKKLDHAPSGVEIQRLLERVGYRYLKLTPAGLAKTRVDVSLDLSSIAKGYGVDRVAEMLEAHGYRNYLVDIGGELRMKGRRFDKFWRIGVEVPDSHVEAVQSVITIKQLRLAMATSGNYRNYKVYGSVDAVHTINPKTGRPERSRLLSVTVIGQDCMTADAYATALMALGEKKAARFAEKYELPVLFIYAGNRPGTFAVKTSSRYDALMGEQSK